MDSSTASNSIAAKLDSLSSSSSLKDHPLAAFSLASLATDQGNRSGGSLSLMNLNMNFDTGVFLKSGSFDCLNNLLGSSIFKDPNSAIAIPLPTSLISEVKNAHSPTADKNHSQSSNANQSVTTTTTTTTTTTPATSTPAQTYNAVGTPTHQSPPSFSHLPIVSATVPVTVNVSSITKSIIPASIPSNVISTSSLPPQQIMPFGNNALIQPKEADRNDRKDDNSKFVDVTPFLTLPQHEAAKKLGIPSSTLAKRWKEASCNRKWPYRTVSKLDKEILTLLKNVENAKAELSPSVEATLGLLLKKRQEELKTVLVRL